MDFQKEVLNLLKKLVKEPTLEIPPNPELGDYAFPCFSLAKEYKKSPNEIAQELVRKIPLNKYIKEIRVNGPYINFFINKQIFASETIQDILKKKDKYGASNMGKNEKLIIEHTSINPNAPPHVGRMRNALIGDSLSKIYKFLNYNVKTRYYVNDIGKQIAMLVLATKGKSRFDKLLHEYIKINRQIEKNPKLEKKVFELLEKLEKGDKKTRSQFKKTVDICIKGQRKILADFGIKFDSFDYESKYLLNKQTNDVLEKLKKTRKLFRDEQNRFVLDLKDFDLPMRSKVLVLTRSTGTSLYPLRDIAYTIDKMKSGKNLIILGEDQKLYFMQLQAALKLLNLESPKAIHYSFVLLKQGKMSTRKGNLVLFEDFAREAVKKASLKNKKSAKKVGEAVVKYSIIKVSPEKSVIFDWNIALGLEGDSAPYLLYSFARASSILKKSRTNKKPDYSLLKTQYELNLIKQLSEFPSVIENAALQYKPNLIANYCYNLAQSFNEFYHNCPVISKNKQLEATRIVLVRAVSQVLKNGLNLLGISVLERM